MTVTHWTHYDGGDEIQPLETRGCCLSTAVTVLAVVRGAQRHLRAQVAPSLDLCCSDVC